MNRNKTWREMRAERDELRAEIARWQRDSLILGFALVVVLGLTMLSVLRNA
jgi:hypothetical protein